MKIALNGILIGGIMLAASLNVAASGKVLVISPRWLGFPGAFAAIAKADGSILSEGNSDAVAVGFSDDPAFVSRLYRFGALFVFSAPNAAGCGSKF